VYLLDTNTCIELLNQANGPVHTRFLSHHPNVLKLCSIVKAELLYGARHSQRVEGNLVLLQRFFDPLESLPFDDQCAEYYGIIRADLMSQGTPIGPNDLMIAATARRYDMVLITHNTREFSRVAGLRLEDWFV
jgi:tRNA(fMet)-specific endonuclease VapC